MKHDKLVRDNIPSIIKQNGGVAVTHIAGDNEYSEKLKQKLVEEVEEFLKGEKTEELADILEVVYALSEAKGIPAKKLNSMKLKKALERGGFSSRIILDETK